MFFRTLFGIDIAVGVVVLFFFVQGIADGSVSLFNIGIWLLLLAVVGAVPAGGLVLRRKNKGKTANALLMVLALPGVIALLFFLTLLITSPRWN